MMLPVQRVEMVTDDLGMSATIGPLYARHRPRARRIARTRIDVGLTAVISAGTAGVTAGREQAIVARGGALLFPLGAQFAVIGHSAAAVALRIPLEAAIARHWGLTRLDRFAVAYRTVYGRPPSHTLRH
jgi:hypothetical protein